MKFGTKVIIALALLANLWFVSSCNNEPKRELWLDEVYTDSCFVQDWGNTADKSVCGMDSAYGKWCCV